MKKTTATIIINSNIRLSSQVARYVEQVVDA